LKEVRVIYSQYVGATQSKFTKIMTFKFSTIVTEKGKEIDNLGYEQRRINHFWIKKKFLKMLFWNLSLLRKTFNLVNRRLENKV